MKWSEVERQREHFNRIESRYFAGRREATHQRLKDLMWADALRSLPETGGRRLKVLEPMCGYAEGKAILQRHLSTELDYSGFDYSDDVVERVRAAHPSERIWQADVTTFEPEAEQYDGIILIGGLHHVPGHAGEVVARLARGLKTGGFFISLEPTSANPLFKGLRKWIYRNNDIFDPQTERDFGVGELVGIFRRAGLLEQYRSYPGLLAYVLYYNPYAFPKLNIGGPRAVDLVFAFERPFHRSCIAGFLSFATLTIWRRGTVGSLVRRQVESVR